MERDVTSDRIHEFQWKNWMATLDKLKDKKIGPIFVGKLIVITDNFKVK